MFSKIIQQAHTKWMALEPAEQYLFWVVSYSIWPIICLVSLFAMPIIGLNTNIYVGLFILVMLGGSVHVLASLYLTVIWPHHYQRPESVPRNTFTRFILRLFNNHKS
jgi:hypothetical protein